MRFGLRELLFLIVLMAIPVAAFQFVFLPRNKEIAQAKKEISEKETRITELNTVTNRVEDLEDAIAAGDEAVQMIEAKLPQEQSVDEVLRQAGIIARERGLNIKKFEPVASVPASKYKEKPIKIELEGNFDGFYEFLLDLEQLPRLTRITDLQMKRLRDEERDGEMSATFTLSVYFQPSRKGSPKKLAGVTP